MHRAPPPVCALFGIRTPRLASITAPLLAAAAWLTCAMATAAAPQSGPGDGNTAALGAGPLWVAVNHLGVLTGVPPTGLCSASDPALRLPPGFAEWSGAYFEGPAGPVKAAAVGRLPDWADRQPVQPVSFQADPDRIVAVTRAGDLQIRTEVSLDPSGDYLLVATQFRNAGSAVLRRVFHTREWFVPGVPGWTFPDNYDAGVGPAAPHVRRLVRSMDDLPPGAYTGTLLVLAPVAPGRDGDDDGEDLDVPLSRWTSPAFPNGIEFGRTRGIGVGDYDGDGWTDVLAAFSGLLWRNLNGTSWQLARSLSEPPLVLSRTYHYSGSFGDYDNDGLQDIAIEPRACCLPNSGCFEMLHNLGGTNFVQVAGGPVISAPCNLDAETVCWGDVDDDGDLDLFLPTYPPWGGGIGTGGNYFWTNQGAQAGYTFVETTAASGLTNPPETARPEGAQLCDVDFDGDLDLYSNGTLYQNLSTRGTPYFAAMADAASGIGLSGQLDEGAVFVDYDMDGDQDLICAYVALGNVLWENAGDGTFAAEPGVIQSPSLGSDLGISAADWDNDGDHDLTTRNFFRRNQLMETGQRSFTLATHAIPASFLTYPTPCWVDWDRDGDLDCVLGNWAEIGRLLQNDTYGVSEPPAARRYVRVRPTREAPGVPRGLENEYGAAVEVSIAEETRRRVQFTASGAGYINQNEYALHFALPEDPLPANPAEDLRFNVAVTFPTLPSSGVHRVDGRINPALRRINLVDLSDRELDVYRNGRVRINGCSILPSPSESPVLSTSGGAGLALSSATTPLPAPSPAPGNSWFVGLAFDTAPAAGPVRVVEVVVDGVFAAPAGGPGAFNLALWDVTNATSPALVPAAVTRVPPAPRNRRHRVPVDWVLAAGRQYRLVAAVTALRRSGFAGPTVDGPMTTAGGLSFQDHSPTSGAAVARATVDPSSLYVAVRARPAMVGVWSDLGNGSGGGAAPPVAAGSGTASAGSQFAITLSGAPPNAAGVLAGGASLQCAPLAGGQVLPAVSFYIPVQADQSGKAVLGGTWPGGVAAGTELFLQFILADAAAPQGLAFSNGLWITTP